MAIKAYWTLVFFTSLLCGVLTVADQSSEYTLLGQSAPGRQSYFENYIKGLEKIQQAHRFSKNGDVVREMSQLWSNLVTAPPSDGVRDELGSDPFSESSSGQSPLMSAIMDTVSQPYGSSCDNDTARVLMNVLQGKMWALTFLDSAGKPGPSLMDGRFQFIGNYKECRSIVAPDDPLTNSTSFGANYVVLTLVYGNYEPLNPGASLNIIWGMCIPDSCSSAEITGVFDEVLGKLNLNGTFTLLPAEIRNSEREVTGATVVAIIVLCIIGSLMILGTAFDVIFVQWPKWRAHANADSESLMTTDDRVRNTNATPPADGKEADQEDVPLLGKPATMKNFEKSSHKTGVLAKVLVAFSVYTNGSKVLNTSQPPGSLTCVHGIRFLSLTWVILGHCLIFTALTPGFLNPMQIIDYFKRWTFDVISNAPFSVDTFFTLSGLLTSYILMKQMKKQGWKINWGLVYFHRFWRLTPPYMLTIVLVLGLQRFLGEGELWGTVQPQDKEMCEDKWWTNLLYINNFYGVQDMCFGHSWYLANDMQFFVLSPLILIPFCINLYAGLASCLVFLLTTMITIGVLVNEKEWPVALIGVQNGTLAVSLSDYFEDYYIKPWCRIGPYVIGVLAGYILVSNNNKVHMKGYQVVVGWAIATASALAIIYGLHSYVSGEATSTVEVSALYNAVSRTAWAVCVCWVIIACVSGYGGFVNTLLSWSPFVVLGRLTYMAYLIHPCVIYVYVANRATLFFLNDLNITVFFLGIVFLSYMVAFVLMLGLESPMLGLEKIFIPQRKKD